MTDRYMQSRALLKRAEQSLAGGVSSNVRRGDKPYPLYFDSGTGSRLFDVDGNDLSVEALRGTPAAPDQS